MSCYVFYITARLTKFAILVYMINMLLIFPLSGKSIIHLPHLCLILKHFISMTVNYQHAILEGMIGDNSLKFHR